MTLHAVAFHPFSRPAALMAVAVALAVSPACFRLTRHYPQKRFFALEATRAGEAGKAPAGTVFAVRDFGAIAPYNKREFIYRLSGSRFDSDFYSEFIAEPAVLVAQQTGRWLEAAGVAGNVVALGSQVEPTHVVEGSLSALYGDFAQAGSPRAVMELDLYVVDNTAARPRFVFKGAYRESIAIEGADAENLARGWNEALGAILKRFEEDLRGVELTRAATRP